MVYRDRNTFIQASLAVRWSGDIWPLTRYGVFLHSTETMSGWIQILGAAKIFSLRAS